MRQPTANDMTHSECASCGEVFRFWRCQACGSRVMGGYRERNVVWQLTKDRCRECHDEKVHGIIPAAPTGRRRR